MTAGAADSEACPLGVNPDDCRQHAVSGFVVRETSLHSSFKSVTITIVT